MNNKSQWTKNKFCASLIAIVILIESCAYRNVVSKNLVSVPAPVLSGVHEIDPNSPPTDGVWMSWADANAMAVEKRNERLLLQEKELVCKKEISRLNLYNESMVKQIKNDIKNSWWYVWGFPIGIVAGVLVGSIVPIAIFGVNK